MAAFFWSCSSFSTALSLIVGGLPSEDVPIVGRLVEMLVKFFREACTRRVR
jgi:hypothetical protein